MIDEIFTFKLPAGNTSFYDKTFNLVGPKDTNLFNGIIVYGRSYSPYDYQIRTTCHTATNYFAVPSTAEQTITVHSRYSDRDGCFASALSIDGGNTFWVEGREPLNRYGITQHNFKSYLYPMTVGATDFTGLSLDLNKSIVLKDGVSIYNPCNYKMSPAKYVLAISSGTIDGKVQEVEGSLIYNAGGGIIPSRPYVGTEQYTETVLYCTMGEQAEGTRLGSVSVMWTDSGTRYRLSAQPYFRDGGIVLEGTLTNQTAGTDEPINQTLLPLYDSSKSYLICIGFKGFFMIEATEGEIPPVSSWPYQYSLEQYSGMSTMQSASLYSGAVFPINLNKSYLVSPDGSKYCCLVQDDLSHYKTTDKIIL